MIDYTIDAALRLELSRKIPSSQLWQELYLRKLLLAMAPGNFNYVS